MEGGEKILYADLSYAIVGSAFRVFNNTEYGMREKLYQAAFAEELSSTNLKFEREKGIPLTYENKKIGLYYLDFVVEGKIVIELKVRHSLGYIHVRQVMGYLKAGGYKLAILIYFTREGVKYRRVINAR